MMQHAGILPNHGDPMVIGCGFDHESGEQLGVLTVKKVNNRDLESSRNK